MSKVIYSLYAALDKRDNKKVFLLLRGPNDLTLPSNQYTVLTYNSVIDAVRYRTKSNPDYYVWGECANGLHHFTFEQRDLIGNWQGAINDE